MNQEIDLINLQSRLNNLQSKLNSIYWKSNEYFYITRPTQEVLKKYKKREKFDLKMRIIWVFMFPFKILFWYLVNIFYLIMKPGREIKPKHSEYGTLFISHSTIENPNPQKGDRIFGDMLSIVPKNSQNLVYYLNHTNDNLKIKMEKIEESIKQEFILNTKNLPFKRMLDLINNNSKIVIKEFLKNSKKVFFRNFEVNWFGALELQIKRSTLASLVVYQNIYSLLNITKIRNLVLTFEGHAYETLIFEAVKLSNKKTKIYMFQHAPTSDGQLALLKFLKTCKRELNILFSSRYSKQYFMKKSEAAYAKKYLVGSPKHSEAQVPKQNRKSILLAPEGTNSTLLEFMILAEKLISKTDYKIILRIHPALKINRYNKKYLNYLRSFSNIEISSQSLLKDFNQSKICIFRASSVGLESLAFGIAPYFYGSEWENYYVNPLRHISSNKKFINTRNLDSEIRHLQCNGKKINYYQKLNTDYLQKLFR